LNGEAGGIPPFLFEIIEQLRRHQLSIGVYDCRELQRALRAGFGISSTAALRELCVALWATSRSEADVIRAVFVRTGQVPRWEIGTAKAPRDPAAAVPRPATVARPSAQRSAPPAEPIASPPLPGGQTTIAAFPLASESALLLAARYPITGREVAQCLRRLRRPRRQGPPVELDLWATIQRDVRLGQALPPVLVPRRRNTARLTVLVDRHGSMAPYHQFVDHVLSAIARSGHLDTLTVRYFHDVPGRAADPALLDELPPDASGRIDHVLDRVPPLTHARVYDDPQLSRDRSLAEVLAAVGGHGGIAVISDAGATRGTFDALRLLDTVALGKLLALRHVTPVWLNPVPARRWRSSTAGQISRHLPMFPLNREGLHGAVDVLRGRPAAVERPV
jgi:uncharacterized protein with von Willebrand factor type A (vWA) domain